MGLFSPPKNRKIAEIIRIDTPRAARQAVKKLESLLRAGKISKTQAVRYANLAANRAKVMLRRKNLSRKERRELSQVSKIYRSFVDKHKKSGRKKTNRTRRRRKK